MMRKIVQADEKKGRKMGIRQTEQRLDAKMNNI